MAVMARSAQHLRGLGQRRISVILNDRVSRAFLLSGDARAMALEANAHLVTELRLADVWPRPGRPISEDDGA